ncbi:hypothetical protein GALMADRAFT_278696 [Galerina marginata CBS 339.88]|uniref:Uncharacterized protein n=1 Tax=Galerina marginata (strain CBS 339.88) TaxID=685588 RepID=A0A067TF17_GALM3|nr:hypothetical protein GALMADRAFT_278696 [Galerina marginata CBS 339.88]
MSHVIIRSDNDPASKAMVILGVKISPLGSGHHRTKVFCAIITGSSEFSRALDRLTAGYSSSEEGKRGCVNANSFEETIGYVHLDQIAKPLHSGHIMSVAIRPGPGTSESVRDLDQNYRVMITVTPPNLLPIPVNSLSVAPRPVVTLPRLTIRLDVGEWEASVYPKQNWSSRGLTWIPTARHQSAILWLTSTRGELMSPILLFHVVDSDIALEFADAPSKLVSASTLDEWTSMQTSHYIISLDIYDQLYTHRAKQSGTFGKELEQQSVAQEVRDYSVNKQGNEPETSFQLQKAQE